MTTQTPPTIPADDFLLDGDRAWMIVPTSAALFWQSDLDRPCDTCDGFGCDKGRPNPPHTDCNPCPARCIAGRHTWNVQVECPDSLHKPTPSDPLDDDPDYSPGDPECSQCDESGVIGFRVSVVPGMGAVPIVDEQQILNGAPTPAWCIIYRDESNAWLSGPPSEGIHRINPPKPGARPGRFAALLNVERIAS